ncbi:hypothetical protein MCHLDSM_00779 [Mycolicibacterium chlorophenolicum]|uniref:Uncharacterized protein n=2 Tax=Mycolicibacterium chlorophenolicum TaxID=37916 RepID=A0A0J6WMD8_9MYCO|nr:hypothetical protein MCHLDSM_00779 [Mycolicibacterium chlorophenolicum]
MMLWDMIVLAGVVAIAVIPFVVFAWWARRRMRQRRWIQWPEPPVHISTRPLPRIVDPPMPNNEAD